MRVATHRLQSCASNTACGTGKLCFGGACVPSDWTDSTQPKGTYDPTKDVNGSVEIVHLKGDGDYLFYISTSLSDESGF